MCGGLHVDDLVALEVGGEDVECRRVAVDDVLVVVVGDALFDLGV